MSARQLHMSQAAAPVLQGFRALCSLTLLERLWLSRFGLLGRLPGSVGTCLEQALPVLHLLHTQAAGASAGPSAQASLLLQPVLNIQHWQAHAGLFLTDWEAAQTQKGGFRAPRNVFCMGRLMCPAYRPLHPCCAWACTWQTHTCRVERG